MAVFAATVLGGIFIIFDLEKSRQLQDELETLVKFSLGEVLFLIPKTTCYSECGNP